MNKKHILLLILISSLLMACGQTKTSNDLGSSDNSSRDLPDNLSDVTRNVNGRLALCNGFSDSGSNFSGLVSTHLENGVTDFNQIRLVLTSVPQQLESSNDFKAEMRLWHEQSRGNIVNAPSVTDFRIQHKATGSYVSFNGSTYGLSLFPADAHEFNMISRPLMQQIQNDVNNAIPGSFSGSLAEFLEETILVLQDVTISYQAVSIAMYPMDGGSAVSNAEFLIPPFYADPNVYEYTHDSLNLLLMHPNYASRGSGLTDDEFYLQTNTYCEQML